jgi:hypothetical protein
VGGGQVAVAVPACRGHRARQWIVTGLDDGMAWLAVAASELLLEKQQFLSPNPCSVVA